MDLGPELMRPRNVADSIYSRFEGAEFVNVTGVGKVWIGASFPVMMVSALG